MRMIPLAEYAPEPGELVEFRVPDGVLGAATAAAPEHPAPPGHLQETHLRQRLTRPGEPQDTWLGLSFDLPGPLDTAAMARALTTWLRRHPTLLTWFTSDGERIHRHALPPEEVAFDALPLGTHDSGQEIRDRLRDRFARGTDPTGWPPLVVCAIRRGATSTIVLAVDHAHTDGLSMLYTFGELRACYTAALTGTTARFPETGSYVDFCRLERERSALLDASSPEVTGWRDFLAPAPFPTAFDLGIAPRTPLPAAAVTVDLLDAAEATAFAHACTTHGADFATGVLAAFAVCGRALGGPDTYRALTLVHTRDERRWRYAHGWFVNTVPVEFPARGRTFAEVLTAARTGLERARRLSALTPARLLELRPELGPALADTADALPLVSYLDCRPVRGSADWAEHDVNSLVAMGRTAVPRLWVNRLRDRTYLRIAHPDTDVARKSVLTFAALVHDLLHEAARTDGTCATPGRSG
ncbi:condensation domain-containing protein [Streptomyces sp. NPDC002643]